VQQFEKYRRNYIPERSDQRLAKLYKQQAKIMSKIKIEEMVEKISRKESVVPEKPYERVHLHQQQSNYKIVPQRENSKHEPLVDLDPMESVIKLKTTLVEEITQQGITVSVLVIGFFLGVKAIGAIRRGLGGGGL